MLSIQRVLVKHGLDEIVWNTHLFRPLAWVGRLLAFGRRRQPLGERLRHALEELGPIFVKFGQPLSMRPDLLPPDIAAGLRGCRITCRRSPGDQAAAALGGPSAARWSRVRRFDPEPLASASVAQVHAARLRGRARPSS